MQVVARSTDDDTDVATVTTTDSPFTGQVGQWHFVTGVIDYATNSVRIYIDGVQDTISPPTSSEPGTKVLKLNWNTAAMIPRCPSQQ